MSALFALSALVALQTWKPYTSATDHFTATFPGTVTSQSSDQNVGGMTITTRIYVCGFQGMAYLVSATDIPASLPASERKNLVGGVKKGFSSTTGLKAGSDSPATFGGIKGTLVKFTNENKNAVLWIVDRPKTLYALTVFAQGKDLTASYNKFFGSFKVR